MTESARFWDKIAERYAKKPVADEAAYQKKLHVTQDYFNPEAEVLELGCGTGTTAIYHAPKVKHIQAVDISAEMLAIADRKAKAAACDNVTFVRSSIDGYAAPEHSFDAVLAMSVLHLLADPAAVIVRVNKMLKPGGVFVTSTACLGDNMKFFKLIGPVGKALGLMPLVKVFTTEDLVGYMEDAGFAIEYQWQPGKNTGVFMVAKKVDAEPAPDS